MLICSSVDFCEEVILQAMGNLAAMQQEREAILYKAATIHASTGRILPSRDVLQTLASLLSTLEAQYKTQKAIIGVVKVR